MMKRYLLFLFVLSTLVCRAYDFEVNGIYYVYDLDNMTASVSGCNDTCRYVCLEETVNFNSKTFRVTGFNGSAFAKKKIVSISIPNSITSINRETFANCEQLTNVCLPSSLLSIGQYAFKGCTSLTEMILPASLCEISEGAFYGSQYLTISVDENNSHFVTIDDVLYDKLLATLYYYPANKEGDFYIVPEDVKTIYDFAFYGCEKLINVFLPSNLTRIGAFAFFNCNNLEEIDIPDGVNDIGNGEDGHHSIEIPEGSTFSGCTHLKRISLGKSLNKIPIYCFSSCKSLSSISIPSAVTNIYTNAFQSCSKLKSVIFEDSDSPISVNTYSTTESKIYIKDIYIGRELDGIINNWWNYPLFLPDSITKATFSSTYSLSLNPVINSTLLQKVICYNTSPSTINQFNSSVYANATLYIPVGTRSIYEETEGWKQFFNIVEGEPTDEDPPLLEQCATPTIYYQNGKIYFTCETEGVRYIPTVSVLPKQMLNGSVLELGSMIQVNVYAVKDGYENSKTATKTINMNQIGDVNADGKLNAADITALVNAILGK